MFGNAWQALVMVTSELRVAVAVPKPLDILLHPHEFAMTQPNLARRKHGCDL